MRIYLETERLVLREFVEGDADHLIALGSDPAVMRLLTGGVPTPPAVIREQTLPAFLAYHARGQAFGYFAAVEKATGDFIGWFHFRPSRFDPAAIELGYQLARAAWGQGYATEGGQALIRKGFEELGVERVNAVTLAEHAASRRVMEKVGLRFTRDITLDGEPGAWHLGRPAVEYALTRDEWVRGDQSR